MFAAWLMVFFEKQFRKFVPNAVDIIITPLLTLLTVGILTIAAVQPIAGFFRMVLQVQSMSLLDVGGVVAGGLLQVSSYR